MKDDIKEILDDLKFTSEQTNARLEFTQKGCETLLDYITNLQEENRVLKELNVCVGCNNNPDYKSRNEKAIEYITSEETINMFSSINAREKWLKINHKLLNILQGEGKQ